MNDQADDFDQAEEEILTPTVSDGAMESAAGTESKIGYSYLTNSYLGSGGVVYCC